MVRNVLGRDDGPNARYLAGTADIEPSNESVGKRASQDLAVKHALNLQVLEVLGVARGLGDSVDPGKRFPDDGRIGHT